jgi:N-dimethylarginine dimethylaminohydrolase
MPLGGGHAIVCPEAFVHEEQLNTLRNRHSFCVDVTLEEAALLQTNLLHTAPDTLLIDPGFTRISEALLDLGYRLIHCPLDKVGHMGGLFRCSTLPLRRS